VRPHWVERRQGWTWFGRQTTIVSFGDGPFKGAIRPLPLASSLSNKFSSANRSCCCGRPFRWSFAYAGQDRILEKAAGAIPTNCRPAIKPDRA